MSKAANRVHLANAMILWKVVPIKREWTDTLSLFPWEMKDSRQVRCIGPICVIFLCLPIIIVVIFFIIFQCFLDRFHPYRLLFFCEGGGYDQIRCTSACWGVLRCEHSTFKGNLCSSPFSRSWKITFGIHL